MSGLVGPVSDPAEPVNGPVGRRAGMVARQRPREAKLGALPLLREPSGVVGLPSVKVADHRTARPSPRSPWRSAPAPPPFGQDEPPGPLPVRRMRRTSPGQDGHLDAAPARRARPATSPGRDGHPDAAPLRRAHPRMSPKRGGRPDVPPVGRPRPEPSPDRDGPPDAPPEREVDRKPLPRADGRLGPSARRPQHPPQAMRARVGPGRRTRSCRSGLPDQAALHRFRTVACWSANRARPWRSGCRRRRRAESAETWAASSALCAPRAWSASAWWFLNGLGGMPAGPVQAFRHSGERNRAPRGHACDRPSRPNGGRCSVGGGPDRPRRGPTHLRQRSGRPKLPCAWRVATHGRPLPGPSGRRDGDECRPGQGRHSVRR